MAYVELQFRRQTIFLEDKKHLLCEQIATSALHRIAKYEQTLFHQPISKNVEHINIIVIYYIYIYIIFDMNRFNVCNILTKTVGGKEVVNINPAP